MAQTFPTTAPLAPRIMTTCRALACASAWWLAASPVAAQVISLAEAYDRMFEREAQYQILELEQDVADELVRQAFGQRLPRVGLSISYIYTQQDIISQDNETFEEGSSAYPTSSVTFTVTQPIYDAVRWRGLPVAEAEKSLIGARAEVARNELSTLLVGAFLDIARAQIALDQAQVMITARNQLERDIAAQVDAGRAEADILLRAQGDLFEGRAVQAEREFDLSTALFELYRFTGPDVQGVSYAGGAVGIPNFDSLVATFSPERLAEMSPAIQVARAELDVAERQLLATRASFRPTANLTLELEYEQTEGSLFGGGSEVTSAEIGVGVDWNIYEGGVRGSRVREAAARVEIARLRLAQVIDLSERRYAALTVGLDRSLESVGAIGGEQAAAERRLAAANEQETAGRIGPAAALEAALRRDTLQLQSQIARLRAVQLQAELLALFGALDMEKLSQDFRGT